MEDKIMMGVMEKHCAAVIDAQETGSEDAIRDAMEQVAVTAMMLCGYKWNEETGKFEMSDK